MNNTHEGVSLLVKVQALACTFTKSNTLLWVFFYFFKLYKWYQSKESHMKPKQIFMGHFYLLPSPVYGTIDILTIPETKLYAIFLSA